MWLLDVNVLLALAWRDHLHHVPAMAWLGLHRQETICTCAVTELGFVRISSGRMTNGLNATVEDATEQLQVFTSALAHRFLSTPLAWSEVWRDHGPLRGHQQVNDAYLLALAKVNGGRLVTFDRGIAALRGAEGVVELLTQ